MAKVRFDMESVEGDMEVNISNTFTETDAKSSKPYTVYEIDILEDGKKWSVKRRYKDFHALHNNLCRVFNSGFLPALPPKFWLGSLKPDKVAKRKVQLFRYLQEILSHDELYDSRYVREFLEIDSHIMASTPRFSLSLKATEIIETAEALFNYNKTENDELSFKKGEKVSIIKKDDSGWWYGICNGSTGFFPSNFVKSISTSTSTSEAGLADPKLSDEDSEEDQGSSDDELSSEEGEGQPGLVVHGYDKEEEGEVSVQEGDEVDVFGSQEGWSYVLNKRSGEKGYVPDSYIKVQQ